MSLDSASHVSFPQSGTSYAPTSSPQTLGTRWAVAAGHPLAAEAAARMLHAGGNAVDAGVAGGICLGVVHCDMVSVAGVAPILVHMAGTRQTWQVSGVGPYPAASTPEFFHTRHKSQIAPGLARTVVPAAPAAWLTALERWGTMSFADVVAPALGHAERGFPVSAFSAYQMGANADKYKRWPSSEALYLKNGRAHAMGERLVQAELGETLRRMVAAEKRAGGSRADGIRAARDEFYRGETAKRIAEFHRSEGGPLSLADLAKFSVDVDKPLTTTFGRYEIASGGFWCQGPVLLHIFNMLEGIDLKSLGHNTPAYLHRIVETIKLAFSDRDAYFGDPKFVTIPERLLSKAYARIRRELVGQRAWAEMPPAGDPVAMSATRRSESALPVAGGSSDSLDTSYVAVVDADGNAFSATPSDPNVDSPVIPGVGCVVSPRGSQGWLDPSHPSVVAPGKRPRLTPAPAMAFVDGRAFMPFGTPGGDVQMQAMLQVFLNATVFDMPMQQAVEATRVASRSFPDSFWPHAYSPGKLEVEGRVPAETRDALAALGHDISMWPDWEWRAGAVCAVRVADDGTRWGGADPRRGAHAIAS